jgi:hypothetical protein
MVTYLYLYFPNTVPCTKLELINICRRKIKLWERGRGKRGEGDLKKIQAWHWYKS